MGYGDDFDIYSDEELGIGEVSQEDTITEESESNSTKDSINVEEHNEGISSEGSELGQEKADEPEEVDEQEGVTFNQQLNLNDLGLDVDETQQDEEDDIFNPEEKLKIFADTILSCCFGDKPIKSYALYKLMLVSNPRLFRDENYVLFSVLFAYRGKLRRINIDGEFIRLFLNRNRKILTSATAYIDLGAYGEISGSRELGYIAGVVKHYNRLLAMPSITEEEFNTCFEKYLIEFKAIEGAKVYNKSAIILTEGLRIGVKKLFGFEDSNNYARKQLADIEGLVDLNKGSGFVTMSEYLKNEKSDGKKRYKVSDFDRLESLNKVYGGIYTSTFLQILAPPKAGKTKFCERICHTTVVKYGNNVTVWPKEGGIDAWVAQMRAIHFDYIYNTGKSIQDRKFGIDQKVIENDLFPNPELKELELSSKRDLESNPNYGSVDFIDRPFNVETFLDDIDTSVTENGSQIVIVDYLQLIGSIRNISERERVAEAYRNALVYCKEKNITFITPGQYKQDFIESLMASGNAGNTDTRTSGGGSAETIRTPDIIFTLWATTQDLLNNEMQILSTPARESKPFPPIKVVHDLSVCQFIG